MVHAFPKSSSLKVNIAVGLEFELAYFVAAIQHFSHYAVGTSQSDDVSTVVIYEALCFDIAQGQMNGAPNETMSQQ